MAQGGRYTPGIFVSLCSCKLQGVPWVVGRVPWWLAQSRGVVLVGVSPSDLPQVLGVTCPTVRGIGIWGYYSYPPALGLR